MSLLLEETARFAAERETVCSSIRVLLVSELGFDVDPDWIDNDQPLFGRGLELDSLDAIELLIAVEDAFGVELDEQDPSIFGSVNALADRVVSTLQLRDRVA